MRHARFCVFILTLLCAALFPHDVYGGPKNAGRLEKLRNELARLSSLPPHYIEQVLSDERLTVRRSERTPECEAVQGPKGEEDDWLVEHPEYLLLGARSLELGVAYYRAHEEDFGAAFVRYGVPPEYILGILRLESYFGRCGGEHVVLPQLAHLYSALPAKASFALREMASLLRLAHRYGWSGEKLFGIRGSVMGAFGIAQFLPTSYLAYGKDGDGDGDVDLFDPKDVIPSVANFLIKNRWREGEWSAIRRYNHADWYANAVIKYANALRPLLQ